MSIINILKKIGNSTKKFFTSEERALEVAYQLELDKQYMNHSYTFIEKSGGIFTVERIDLKPIWEANIGFHDFLGFKVTVNFEPISKGCRPCSESLEWFEEGIKYGAILPYSTL